MMKLSSQLVAVVWVVFGSCQLSCSNNWNSPETESVLSLTMERHFARTFSGNSSPVTTHATGPQELATGLAVRRETICDHAQSPASTHRRRCICKRKQWLLAALGGRTFRLRSR